MKQTLIDLVENSVEKYSSLTFLLEKTSDKFEPTTFKELKEQVYDFGAGLCALGIRPKENVAILSEGRNLWIISELGLLYTGAVSVPLSIKLEEGNDLYFRLSHADVEAIIVSGRQLGKIRSIKERLPLMKTIIVLDKLDKYEEGEIYYGDVAEKGRAYLVGHRQEFIEMAQSIQNDDLATITYTSGTTSDPKGVALTHRNYTANVEQATRLFPIPPKMKMLIILPLDHCFAHVVGFYTMIKCGGMVATVPVGKSAMESLRNIPMSIKEVKPNILLSVPALAKNFKKNIEQSVRNSGKIAEILFNFGLNTAIKYNKEGWNKGSGGTFILKPIVWLYDKTLFKKVRQGMGGELEFFVGGGALLDIDLQKFYYALGIPMFQGYGLSEATPIISSNTVKKHRLGSSGVLATPMELKIMSDGKECPAGVPGEIVIKGEQVMAGYWKNPKATAETVVDGWLFTGDMGYMHESGLLYVLGRYKSLLIASDGEKYAPEGIEESIVERNPFILNAMLYNNQSPYTICVLDVDKKKLSPGQKGLEEIKKGLDKFRTGGEFAGMFPERWLPTTFIVADEPFSEQNRMINSTMKMVRSKVEAAYKERIEYAFTPDGKNYLNQYNLKAMN